MPELPEVETTLRGIETALRGKRVKRLIIRDNRLRWPVPTELAEKIRGREIRSLRRRAKYILIDFSHGCMIWHLGMSGSMRIVDRQTGLKKHDHIDLVLRDGQVMRYNDPRRFGCLLWTQDTASHPLLLSLGPEPLAEVFNGDYLYHRAQNRKATIKSFIMDQKLVVGVGNIYASEALFLAGISPLRQAGRISRARYVRLASQIKQVLQQAIEQGGTTLRDFSQADGRPGYFDQQLMVYGRQGQPCFECGNPVSNRVIAQRASYYCKVCQH